MASESTLEAALYVPSSRPEGSPRLDLTLSARAGVTLLWGPSGSGKTTCLMALAGLVHPQRGHIVLGDRTLFDHDKRIWVPANERRVGLVFQSLALFPHLTVEQNVAFGIPRHVAPRQRPERVAHWLTRMRVGHLAARTPAALSGGEAQRVALARALASEPTLLLLDEPFSALDVALRRELTDELSVVVEQLGVPALLVTHHLEDRARWPLAVIELSARETHTNAALSRSPPDIVRNPTTRLPVRP